MKKCLGPCVGAVTDADVRRRGRRRAAGAARPGRASVLERAARAPRRAGRGAAVRGSGRAARSHPRRRAGRRRPAAAEWLQRTATWCWSRPIVQPDRRAAAADSRRAAGRGGFATGARDAVAPAPSAAAGLRAVDGAQVSRDELDDLLILDAWLKRHQAEVREISVSSARSGGQRRRAAGGAHQPTPARRPGLR